MAILVLKQTSLFFAIDDRDELRVHAFGIGSACVDHSQ
jgi:hypothetical protein